MLERKIIEPVPSPEMAEFWQAASAGRFLLRSCLACARAHWYPRAVCPLCFSQETIWIEGSGRGSIYTYSVMRKAPQMYAIAYVRLAEGPVMMSNIVDCDFDRLAVAQPVAIVFKRSAGGFSLPMFRPLS